MKTQPKIFLSYCHKNFEVAESIDKDFQRIGIMFRRDVRDVGYMESFKKFMERIRENGYALMIISDEYLKSENCMYEVLEFMKERDVQERILLIVLENANIFSISGKADYIKHWNNKFEEINNKIKDLPSEDSIPLIEELKKLKKIKSDIADFLKIISDRKSVALSILKQDNYRAIVEKIDFENGELLEELLKIGKIIDNEEQDIELDKLINLNPKFSKAYFLRAYLANSRDEFKKAKYYYEVALKIFPDYIDALNNLGLLLADKFDDKEGARMHYEDAININPNFAEAHNNLGLLLADKFNDKEGARMHYEDAIRINPNNCEAHYNLGILLIDKFDDKKGARKHYEDAIRINPDFVEAQYNLGLLLADKFDEKESARKCYEETLRINPDNGDAHYNLGLILDEKFNDKVGAKMHYEEAIRINPKDVDSNYYLGLLLDKKFNDKVGAKKHYLIAIALKPELRSEKTDKYFEVT